MERWYLSNGKTHETNVLSRRLKVKSIKRSEARPYQKKILQSIRPFIINWLLADDRSDNYIDESKALWF